MGKRGPEPKPETELRRHPITCRVTDAELIRIDAGRPEGMTRGEWIRTKALKRKLPRAIPEINRKAWADLARSLGNLNQIAKHLNQGGGDLAGAVATVEQIRAEVQKLRQQLISGTNGMELLTQEVAELFKPIPQGENES